jgi:hypothetical protein
VERKGKRRNRKGKKGERKMKKKSFAIIAGVIGFVAAFCTVAGFAIRGCISEIDNVDFVFDLPKKEEE